MQTENEASTNTQALMGYDPESFEKLKAVEHQPFLLQFMTEHPVRPATGGGLFFTRMDDIRKIQRDPHISSAPIERSSLGNERPLIPLQIDGQLHTQFRKILDPLFSPKRVAPLEPSVRELTNELIDVFIDRGSADLYGEFCAVLPATVFVRLMGIPRDDIQYFMQFKNDLLRIDPAENAAVAQERFVAAGERCYGYFNQLLDERERTDSNSDDLINWFRHAEVGGHTLTRENILDITYLLMIAGLDTVAASLSCFLSWLARHPDERRRVVAAGNMWPQVVEELLRYETPVPNTGRHAGGGDIEVNGQVIPQGTQLAMSWATANLDPDVFPDPLRVDFDRPHIPHVTFASGYHRCLGSHLARMELRVALDQFHKRIPDYWIQEGAELVYEALPVRLVNPLPLAWA